VTSPSASAPSQVHAQLVRAAKRIIADHRPDANGVCPVCRVPSCEALAGALRYLEEFADPPE
jgi:hypothetical protein